jgi:hypothetical protein
MFRIFGLFINSERSSLGLYPSLGNNSRPMRLLRPLSKFAHLPAVRLSAFAETGQCALYLMGGQPISLEELLTVPAEHWLWA